MRKWDGKSALTLEAQVCELQGKTIPKGVSSEKIASPVSGRQSPRHSNGPMTRTRSGGSMPPGRRRKGAVGLIGLCGLDGMSEL